MWFGPAVRSFPAAFFCVLYVLRFFFFLVQARLSPGAAPCMHEQCGYAAACSRAASTAMANVCMEVQFPSTPTVVAAAVDQ